MVRSIFGTSKFLAWNVTLKELEKMKVIMKTVTLKTGKPTTPYVCFRGKVHFCLAMILTFDL